MTLQVSVIYSIKTAILRISALQHFLQIFLFIYIYTIHLLFDNGRSKTIGENYILKEKYIYESTVIFRIRICKLDHFL